MLVVPVHLRSLAADLHHAVVIGAIQLVQLCLEFVSLLNETVDDSFDVVD